MEGLIMIEVFVGLFVIWLFSSKGKKEQIEPEEYYPFMYDHFNDDGDCDGENLID